MSKFCTHCKAIQDFKYFSKNPSSPDGFKSYCKRCQSQMNCEWRIKTNYKRPKLAGIRKCSACKITKTKNEFYTDTSYNCRICQNEKQKLWKREHKELSRQHKLRYRYGINLNDYNKLFLNQNGKCAICGLPQAEQIKPLEVDHDYVLGKVRGLLCQNCNKVLGLFHDNIKVLFNAIDYLQGMRVR